MGIEQRRHVRFSLDIPAIRYKQNGETVATIITQISLGGCLVEWDEKVYIGDELRMLVQLPNQNYLPLACKAIYKFAEGGIGAKFLDITLFELELLAKIISHTLEEHGLPLQVDPFVQPGRIVANSIPQFSDAHREKDEILEKIL